VSDFDDALEAYRDCIRAMARGDNAPGMALYSRRDDVTLANPLGPPIRGWADIAAEAARVAAGFAGGTMAFEDVTRFEAADFAYIVGFERGTVRRAEGGETVSMALRVTTIFRREEEGWRVALRHADRVAT
jgi:ketosteroid isomerase-like protein